MANDGGPRALRNASYPMGIPEADGRLPIAVKNANRVADNCIKICRAAMSHGAHVVIENPVARGAGSQYAIPGRENHSSLWDYPPKRLAHQAVVQFQVLQALTHSNERMTDMSVPEAQVFFICSFSIWVGEFLHMPSDA